MSKKDVSRSKSSRRSAFDLTGAAGRAAAAPLERLEERVLLSGDAMPGTLMDWGNQQAAVKAGSWIVTFDDLYGSDAAGMAQQVANRLGVSAHSFSPIGRGGHAIFQTGETISLQEARRVTAELGSVLGIEPERYYQVARVPNDPLYGEQWGLNNDGQFIEGSVGTINADISAEEAWDVTIGSRSVIVAVIDTGIEVTHPDLRQNIWVNTGEIPGNGIDDDGNGFVDDINGYDFGEFRGEMTDAQGHGTAVAGTIGAVGGNGIGVTGVAWNVSLMGLKIADRNGALSTAAIIGAHDYVTMMRGRGINVVVSNNSYGAFAPEFYEDQVDGFVAEAEAIRRWINSGGIFVAAAGNDGADNDQDFTAFPASYNVPGIISVAATDNNDGLAGFSNFGAQKVDLAAPGVDIYTTQINSNYGFTSGTSFASPMVAGAVALLKTVKPNASAVEVREALINSADLIPSLQGKVRSGGRLNVERAIQVIQTEGPVLRGVNPGPVTTQVDPNTGLALSTVTLDFSRDIDPNFLSTSGVTLRGNGADNVFGTGDDRIVPVTSVQRDATNPRRVTVQLDLSAFAQQRLPIDEYRLTLDDAAFRDTSGRFLNGNAAAGIDENYDFRIVATSGDFEPNDTLATATPVSFSADGSARFQGVTLGNGLFAALDVDLYRITIPRGGQIKAETFARRLPSPSSLDTVVRLFDGAGQQLAANDNFSGLDSLVDFFVTTGGTYYIGVSGFGNAAYNPAIGGSGASQSTGVYELRLNIALTSDDIVTVNSSSPPRRIPVAENQTQGTTTDIITVADTREILDVNVRLDISHTYVGDLQISLISPQGTEVRLFTRRGGAGDNLSVTLFDDEAVTAISAGVAPFNGSFRPEDSLGAFDGQRANGNWTIRIVDTTALNSGVLNSWSIDFTFQNDIFGPFEANDTIPTATNTGITEVGTATLTAFLGDGGFGTLDRDIFRFTARSGTSLSVRVTPSGPLDSAVRLFDETGTQILVAAESGNGQAIIQNYVFAQGGTFYIAVSDSSNTDYDPNQVATGTVSATTGGYTLTVEVAAGVSDPSSVLAGNALNVGVSNSGLFRSGSTGLSYNGLDFLPNAASQHSFGLRASDFSFINSYGQAQQPFALTFAGDTFNNRVAINGDFRGLGIERVFSYGVDDAFVAIDVYLTNTTASTVTGVTWLESFNPGPGVSFGDGDATTANDVLAGGRAAQAVYTNTTFEPGRAIVLAAPVADTRATATVLQAGFDPRDPGEVADRAINDPDGAVTDGSLALTYDLGAIAAGETVSMRYFIFLGDTAADAQGLYQQVNDGTGAGHLTADPANPVTEILSDGSVAPELPYRVFYPEGFFGDNIFTFVPIANPNNQATRVTVIARYEVGERDQIIGELNIAANSRSGLTLVDPDLFNSGGTLIRQDAPYAIEVRSERPVSAVFSHYDLNLLQGFRAALGEAFTSRVETTWSFGKVSKGNGNIDFLLMYNTTDTLSKVTVNFYPAAGGAVITEVFNVDAFRRGGLAVNDVVGLADGDYGVTVTSEQPIVASLSHYNANEQEAAGLVGNEGLGSARGAMPEGQVGLSGSTELIGVLNANGAAAQVVFSFIFQDGSSYRTALNVAARSQGVLDVSTLPNFPTNLPYGLFYESNLAVSVTDLSRTYGESISTSTASNAFSLWGFGEGFRPGDGSGHPGVEDYIRIYNPQVTDQVIEITISYDGIPGSEVFRRVVPARRVTEFNVDQFVTGDRRLTNQWYGLTVKASSPVVAYFGHFDRSFPGAFGSLGTPLGLRTTVS